MTSRLKAPARRATDPSRSPSATAATVDLLGAGVSGIGYLLKDRLLNTTDLADAVHRVGTGARPSTRSSSSTS